MDCFPMLHSKPNPLSQVHSLLLVSAYHTLGEQWPPYHCSGFLEWVNENSWSKCHPFLTEPTQGQLETCVLLNNIYSEGCHCLLWGCETSKVKLCALEVSRRKKSRWNHLVLKEKSALNLEFGKFGQTACAKGSCIHHTHVSLYIYFSMGLRQPGSGSDVITHKLSVLILCYA